MTTLTFEDIASLKPLLIRASAGTGKTYQLTGRLLRILLGKATAESVIATTFTRKAAGEILHRVLLSLAKAATDVSGDSRKALANQTGVADLTTEQCVQLTHSLFRDIHRLRIMTLDSLFSQLARSFSYEIGVPPGWRLTDEIEDASMREAAVDALLATLDAPELANILAQLGKGDTKRSVRDELLRVIDDAYQVSRGCKPEAWDSIQVPSQPSDELIVQCENILSEAKVGHSSADKYLHDLVVSIRNRDWMTVGAMKAVANVALLRPNEDLKYYNKVMPPDVACALHVASDCVKTHVLSLLHQQTLATGTVIAAYEKQIVEIKQATRAFSFDDVAHRLAESLSPISMNQIASRMDGSIDHLLLDEFQDTSPVQWNVLQPLAKTSARIDETGSFFCVGDTKQAIYGWRGGVAEIFGQVCDQLDNVAEREQNISFRSSPVITDAVNLIFKNLDRHPEVSSSDTTDAKEAVRRAVLAFSQGFPEHQSAKPDLRGYVTIRSSDVDGSSRTSQRFPHLNYAAARIAETASRAPDLSIGVLTRTNVSVAWLIQMLRNRKVDVSQEGGNPLIDSPAVELVLSALMMPEHPGDRRWAFHVANSPLAKWLQMDDFLSSEFASNRLRRMIEDEGIARTVEEIASHIVEHCDSGDALRLRQLVYLAQQYETNRGSRVTDFVNVVQQKRIEKPRPAQVRVMTVHQAKGLEFDVVVLPELDGELVRPLSGTLGLRDKIDEPPRELLRFINKDFWPLLPKRWQLGFRDQLEAKYTEALCLLYVALTRPRQWLDVIVEPTSKSQPQSKTAAAFLYHATGCECDSSQKAQVWFESGDESFMD